MRRLLVTAAVLALPGTLAAQRMGSPHFAGRTSPLGAHFGRPPFQRTYSSNAFAYPLYSDYLSSTGYAVASQPQVLVLQSPPPALPPEPARPPSEPLMIELQGDRYVQVSGDRASRSQTIDSSPVANLSRVSSKVGATSSAPQPGAVLIFRDGHRQEVSAYTIADGALYASVDYVTTGNWNQKIELSSLNVPDTVSANSSRGLRFQLPSSPNVVIVGP